MLYRCTVCMVPSSFCPLWQRLLFTFSDIIWLWRRQYVTRCKITSPSLPASYKWPCDNSGQWNESGSFWAFQKSFLKETQFACTQLLFSFFLPKLLNVENLIGEYGMTAMNLNAAPWGTRPRAERCCLNDGSPESPIPAWADYLWASCFIFLLFQSFGNLIYSVECLWFGYPVKWGKSAFLPDGSADYDC